MQGVKIFQGNASPQFMSRGRGGLPSQGGLGPQSKWASKSNSAYNPQGALMPQAPHH